jgi:hypothetical protein
MPVASVVVESRRRAMPMLVRVVCSQLSLVLQDARRDVDHHIARQKAEGINPTILAGVDPDFPMVDLSNTAPKRINTVMLHVHCRYWGPFHP